MKALTKKILRLARRRGRTPRGLDNAIERAEAAMAERDWGRATALWRDVLDQFGDRAPPKAHLRLSRALRGDGRIFAAQAVLLEGLKRSPEDLGLRRELAVQRAEAAMAERDWGRATALWREVLDQFGDGAPRKAHLRLSRALRRDGHIVAAQAVLLERLKRDPEDHQLRRELAALVEAGEERPQLRRLPLAPSLQLATSQADWERVARLWKDVLGSASTPAREMAYGLAAALCQLGRFGEADEVLQRAPAEEIDGRDVPSVFDSEVLRTQFLARFTPMATGNKRQGLENLGEWYRVAIGARRLRDASGLNAAVTAPSAIWVCSWNRWGNSVRQLVNALEVAETLDVPRVYIPQTWYLEGDDPIHVRGREVIQSDRPSAEERMVLRGFFFVHEALDTYLSGTEEPYRRLAELRPFTVFRDLEPLREDDLVIHIRAGDVFRRERVHPDYGQPPLAYYLKVLRQHRWRSVSVVYENDHNPVIEPLRDHLRAEGIEHRTVVTDLTSTVEFLLRAKTIVAGHGSFIPTIAGLSPNLRRLYTFEGTTLGIDRHPQGIDRWAGVAQIDVIDDPGVYRRAVMSRNWENRPDQVELMLHYPESSLRVVPRPTARDERGVRDEEAVA